jgi:hypothetical protein
VRRSEQLFVRRKGKFPKKLVRRKGKFLCAVKANILKKSCAVKAIISCAVKGNFVLFYSKKFKIRAPLKGASQRTF